MTDGPFADVDFDDFWDDNPYSLANYVEPAPDDALIASIEQELGGYRLPAAYVALCRHHNGGMVERSHHPMTEPTGWADDHIVIAGFYAIGRTAPYSLCGALGATFMAEAWGYPPIGVGIADTPSAGHEQIMLDYRACGKDGEPSVVHVDQEDDFRITVVAPDFASFVRGLVGADVYDTSAADRAAAIATVEQGSLSPIVVRALAAVADRLPDGEAVLRGLARQIVDAKGCFALHADPRSQLMYDLMFFLYSGLCTAPSRDAFVAGDGANPSYDAPCYTLMIVFNLLAEPYGFRTGGYAKGFLDDWWDARVAAGAIAHTAQGYRFTDDAERALLRRLDAGDAT